MKNKTYMKFKREMYHSCPESKSSKSSRNEAQQKHDTHLSASVRGRRQRCLGVQPRGRTLLGATHARATREPKQTRLDRVLLVLIWLLLVILIILIVIEIIIALLVVVILIIVLVATATIPAVIVRLRPALELVRARGKEETDRALPHRKVLRVQIAAQRGCDERGLGG